MTPEDTTPPTDEADTWRALDEALSTKDSEATNSLLDSLDSEATGLAISRIAPENREALAETLEPASFSNLLSDLPEPQAIELLEQIPADLTAGAIGGLPPETAGQLLRELDAQNAQAILDAIEDPAILVEVRKRLNYPEGSAGSLMRGNTVSFKEDTTVAQLLDLLHDLADQQADRDIQYLYVTDNQLRLTGVLQLRDLLWAPRNLQLRDLMIRNPLSVPLDMDFHQIASLFRENSFLGLPVVGPDGHLVGIIARESVQRETSDEQTELFLASSGIVDGEELRSMPLLERCRKRLAWLAPNIALNLVAASVIAANEATLQEVIALAVFLPIVSDMSGCSGNQAVAVSIRELTLGLLRPGDFIRVILKEGLVGIINGSILGCLLGTIAGLWKNNLFLGLVVATALALNTILSVLLGGLVPLLLKRFKVDPALASGPILTTCTDMCGFFLVLSLASAVIQKLI